MGTWKTQWNLHDKAHWAAILFEIFISYAIFYVSASRDMPGHIYFRFLMLIPLYHSGAIFGYTGSVTASLIMVFLFVPIIPIISQCLIYKNEPAAPFILLVFLVLFGMVVSGTMGATRKTGRYVDKMSKVFMSILEEHDEISIIRRSCAEATALIDAESGAFLAFREGESNPEKWTLSTAASEENISYAQSGASAESILAWTASKNAILATNGAARDPRIKIDESATHVKSIISIPVSFEDSVYGAILFINKKSGDVFSSMDVSVAKAIAETAGSAIHSLAHEKKRQSEKLLEEQMRDLFSKYVSSSVAKYVLERPDLLENRWREITVLVSDIRDFTALSETVAPKELVSQLNEYFTAMVDVIFACKGTIDKFIGDCVIAYWGAPAPDDEHAAHAIQAAKNMRVALDSLNASWAERGMRELQAGISVHTCVALTGNIGDERKKAFTIMGEELENALNLEKITKTLNKSIIISESAAAAVGESENLYEISAGSEVSSKLFSVSVENI